MTDDLDFALVAIRRLLDHIESPQELVDMDDVLRRFGIDRKELEKIPDD